MATPSDTENTNQLESNGGRGNLVFDWTVATIAGLAISPILGIILAMVLFTIGFGTSGGGFGAAIIGAPLGIAAAGLILGWSQASVLMHLDNDTGWTHHIRGPWIGATACGWILGLAGAFGAMRLIAALVPSAAETITGSLAAPLIAWASIGAILGWLQWLVLRAHVRHAGVWIAACAASTAAGGILFHGLLLLFTGYAMPLLGSSIVPVVVAAGIGAAALGIVTGLTLAALLGVPALRPRPSA
jgi:hypothetical protein